MKRCKWLSTVAIIIAIIGLMVSILAWLKNKTNGNVCCGEYDIDLDPFKSINIKVNDHHIGDDSINESSDGIHKSEMESTEE